MPATPETWLSAFTVNPTTSGSQSDARVTQLANGNILVTWESSADTGAGSPAGYDIIARIYDPLGNPVTGEFRLNNASTVDHELEPEITALPNGGFIVVYEDIHGSGTNIRLEEYSATGANLSENALVQLDFSTTRPNYTDPNVAAASNTSVLVTYTEHESGGDSRIVGRIYNPSTDSYGSVINLIDFAGQNTDSDVTVLNNGNYLITATTTNGGDNSLVFRIVDSSGANVRGVTQLPSTVGDGDSDRDFTVTALAGGGFIIGWTNTDSADTDIEVQRFDANGNALGGVINVETGGATDNDNEPVIAALNDGGFIVFYDDDETGNIGIHGQRYDSSGSTVGSNFLVTGANATQIDATLLEDGRVAVTWLAGEIQMQIFDTRDSENDPAVYTPNSWTVGTIGNDTITDDGNDAIIHGWFGDDTITDGGGITEFYGDQGNDVIFVTSGIAADLFDGGIGNDTIDFSGAPLGNGTTINLNLGTVTTGTSSEVIANFENAVGSDANDSILGTSGQNFLSGGQGNDTLSGLDGNDTLMGWNGGDLLYGDGGNDLLNGKAGQDSLRGGSGNDTLKGDGGSDHLHGAKGADLLGGGAGNDTLLGKDGFDKLYGGNGKDLLNGGLGNDIIDGGQNNDTIIGDAGSDVIRGGHGSDEIAANGGNDVIQGNAGYDVINGGWGHDQLDGGGGADTLTGNRGADTLTGGAGADVFVFGNTFGNDVVTDLLDNVDQLDFSGNSQINNFNQFMNAAVQQGANVFVDAGNGTIVLQNTTLAQFDSGDFIF